MICFKCDRCGEVFDWHKADGFNGIAKIRTKKDGANLTAGSEINLCPSCMKTLNDWMRGDAYILTKSEEENRLKDELVKTTAEVVSMTENGTSVPKYKVVLLCRGAGSEDVHCYTVEGKNDRVAESSAVRLCKAHYPEYEEIKPVRMEYVGR